MYVCTATADKAVYKKYTALFGRVDPETTVRMSPDRPNMFIQVEQKKGVDSRDEDTMLAAFEKHFGQYAVALRCHDCASNIQKLVIFVRTVHTAGLLARWFRSSVTSLEFVEKATGASSQAGKSRALDAVTKLGRVMITTG